MSSDTAIRHLIVLGHPGPEGFSHSVAATYGEAVRDCGQEPVLRDLYALDFDPRLTAAERSASGAGRPGADALAEIERLRDSAVIALVYPIWFGMPPAIIKGYIDRVLGSGFAADNLQDGNSSQLLKGKRLMLFTSSASTQPWLEEQGQWLGLRQTFDVYLRTIFGFSSVEHVHFDALVEGTKERYVDECLAQVREAVRAQCAELFDERRRARLEKRQLARQ